MSKHQAHFETHRSIHIGWLRAAVLGANDGIVSTASLLVGVAAAHTSSSQILLSGVAGLVAGAMSMAAGEYVSVSSQKDTETADLNREKFELENNVTHELDELAYIYQTRGLDPELSRVVAQKLMEHDALGSHARDELGITETYTARPFQAAMASALTFAVGATLPLSVAYLSPREKIILLVSVSSLISLIILGMISAHVGGANKFKAAARVLLWGTFAMALTAGIGKIFGVAV